MCFGTGNSSHAESPRMNHQSKSNVHVRRRRTLIGGIPADQLDELAEEVSSARRAQQEERAEQITSLHAEAKASGNEQDRFYWTLVYDMEMAPSTNGRAMILQHRIVPVPPQDLSADDDLHDELWTVIEALAASGVYLLNSDHLSDRDLYARLYYRILDEPTRCLPPESEASEFIDCLHPFDIAVPGAGRLLTERIETVGAPPRAALYSPGVRGPFNRTTLADRDRWLPRPQV